LDDTLMKMLGPILIWGVLLLGGQQVRFMAIDRGFFRVARAMMIVQQICVAAAILTLAVLGAGMVYLGYFA
jgi:hypothetical protein